MKAVCSLVAEKFTHKTSLKRSLSTVLGLAVHCSQYHWKYYLPWLYVVWYAVSLLFQCHNNVLIYR